MGEIAAQGSGAPTLQRGTATVAPAPPQDTATVGPAPQRGTATIAPGPPGGMATIAPPAGMSPQASSCINEFMPMRQAAEKRAQLIGAAVKRKAPREELCKLFGGLVAAETKLVKFMEANRASCGIPNEAIANLKKEYSRVSATRQQVCSGAPTAAPGGPPPGPSLSDALGAPRVPGPATTSSGLGTWDTLTGSPIKR